MALLLGNTLMVKQNSVGQISGQDQVPVNHLLLQNCEGIVSYPSAIMLYDNLIYIYIYIYIYHHKMALSIPNRRLKKL